MLILGKMVYPMAKTNVVSVIVVTILIKSATSNVDLLNISSSTTLCDGDGNMVME